VTLFNSAKNKSELSFSTPLNTWVLASSQGCQFRLDSAQWKSLLKALYPHLNLSPHFLIHVNSSLLGLYLLTITLVLFLIPKASTIVSHMEKRSDCDFNIIRIKLCCVLSGHFLFACSENIWVCSVKFQVLFFSACVGQYYWAAFLWEK